MNTNPLNSEPQPRWVSAQRLYYLLILASILGMILPVLTIILKIAAEDFTLWKNALARIDRLATLVSAYPVLDISKTFSFLSTLSWHHPRASHINFYVRYVVFNSCVLILLVTYRNRLGEFLQRGVNWLHVESHSYARRVIFSVALMIVVVFQTKTHLGFWFNGIAGWTYANWSPAIQESLPQSSYSDISVINELGFLRTAIVPENAIFLPQDNYPTSGYLTGSAMFLHYKDGQVLPANYELTELVFPQYAFGQLYEEIEHPHLFFDVVKAELDDRSKNRRFLLPLSIAYPNHTPYMPIDYSDYPPAEKLEKISFWTLTVSIDKMREIKIVEATQELVVHAN